MRLIIESDGPVRIHLDTGTDDDTQALYPAAEDTGYSHEVGGTYLATDTPAGFTATPSPGTPDEPE